MDEVDVFLDLCDDAGTFLFLSIPKQDMNRLSLSPHKWLRFVMFTICGARGVLSAIPQGPPVEDNTRFADIGESYYYTLRDIDPCFVDYKALNDQVTSTVKTPRAASFRQRVISRDSSCIVKGTTPEECDAAHIISGSKGDAYIELVVRSRRQLYSSPEIEISNINDVRNGTLLSKDLHFRQGIGTIAFLKTPNFVLNCDDIPREGVRVCPDLPYRITMQHLVPASGHWPIPDHDAHLVGTENSLPPAVILDYMYGAAAYQRWKSDGDVHEKLQSYFTRHYQGVLKQKSSKAPHNDYSGSGSDNHDDADSDGDYIPVTTHRTGEHSEGMPVAQAILDLMNGKKLDALDEMNLVLMMLSGTTPEKVAAKFQKQRDEEQLREREASRMKVLEWMGSIAETAPEESEMGVVNTS